MIPFRVIFKLFTLTLWSHLLLCIILQTLWLPPCVLEVSAPALGLVSVFAFP